jgi:hypothetical protein
MLTELTSWQLEFETGTAWGPSNGACNCMRQKGDLHFWTQSNEAVKFSIYRFKQMWNYCGVNVA